MCKSIYDRINSLVQKANYNDNNKHYCFSNNAKDKSVLVRYKSKKNVNYHLDYDENNNVIPFLSHSKRVIPNIMLRSSLFSVIKKGQRKYEKNILKFSLQGIYIRFTGEQLDQSDLDVWLECLHRYTVPIGDKVEFSTYSFLRSIDRSTGTKDYKWLKSCLLRLSICVIEISYQNSFYIGHLLHEWYRNINNNKKHVIVLNKKIVTFFTDEMWTAISLKERKQLKGKYLSQWIHCFYCSHKIPLCYKVSTLNKLCGSTTKLLWKFRQNLKKSLLDVNKATGWKCWIDKNDFVHIIKK
ncbi:plasmid replication initiator TrfA [Enterobacteriaceae endosymbiont of Neohaemonia nigricornis]|uniref:plasmid replication initiator TrfA n=1 Tax=Enterobacteriaceae endosymbiont of Neohaemonia nigricornis TaxID=2675792 RepID=UPI001449F839|nr:plasmid replication initiator TrfA [Enterobacteriaceae endosymbiont of Neohaemonia nigricornis]QJC30638.1 hypothetical protein GJT85_02290 [Enterobacteriaceae endosymbiont of Neohaemonia nigricornis]